MIKRDSYGIICQYSPYDSYGPNHPDGGDSAARTGMLALTGSAQDQSLMVSFETPDQSGSLRRHPYQEPYNDPTSFTRDQLLQFTVGFHTAPNVTLMCRIFWSRLRSGFLCQNVNNIDLSPKPWWNRDILTPECIGHLIILSKLYVLYPFLIVSNCWLILAIIFSAKVQPKAENNQIIALCAVAGDWALKLYCWLHTDYTVPLRDYWGYDVTISQFRYQPEIAQAIIDYVESRIK